MTIGHLAIQSENCILNILLHIFKQISLKHKPLLKFFNKLTAILLNFRDKKTLKFSYNTITYIKLWFHSV